MLGSPLLSSRAAQGTRAPPPLRCRAALPSGVAAPPASDAAGRRALLLLGAGLLVDGARLSLVGTPAARAAIVDDKGYVDQSRKRAKGDCDLGAAGADCRLKALKDASSLSYESQQRIGTTAGGNRGTVAANGDRGKTQGGDAKYVASTQELLDSTEALARMDVYDPKRAAAIDSYKVAADKWSSAYAPGGSSKRASGRAFYNALNQLESHFAFNGLAPIPKSTLEKVERNVAETKLQLGKGK